jgi:hypothetical protein
VVTAGTVVPAATATGVATAETAIVTVAATAETSVTAILRTATSLTVTATPIPVIDPAGRTSQSRTSQSGEQLPASTWTDGSA